MKAARHRLRITYDEEMDTLVVCHVTSITSGDHTVHTSEDISMSDPAAVSVSLRALIDGNRKEMERRAGEATVEHVAALQGIKRAGCKQVKLGGTMGAIGEGK